MKPVFIDKNIIIRFFKKRLKTRDLYFFLLVFIFLAVFFGTLIGDVGLAGLSGASFKNIRNVFLPSDESSDPEEINKIIATKNVINVGDTRFYYPKSWTLIKHCPQLKDSGKCTEIDVDAVFDTNINVPELEKNNIKRGYTVWVLQQNDPGYQNSSLMDILVPAEEINTEFEVYKTTELPGMHGSLTYYVFLDKDNYIRAQITPYDDTTPYDESDGFESQKFIVRDVVELIESLETGV